MFSAHPRLLTALATALLASTVLSGCGPAYPEIPRDAETGGQTLVELEDTLNSIEGLTFSDVGGSDPNIKGNTGFGMKVTLEEGYQLANPGALLVFLTESAWSVRDGYMPNIAVEIRYTGPVDDGIDMTAVGIETGWVPSTSSTPGGADNGFTSVSVPVADSATEKGVPENAVRLGPWPGDVPEVPTGMVVERRD
ncbi:hypothetical protein [Pseudoclavibacter terrae]|uniref:hypothetical protein n=1 Tax=Pseudoclavibacter terrae TaxID=1530195 RepID=UPI00232EA85F|nr:hypothetical protein [Pseudoclavibacter terrae]